MEEYFNINLEFNHSRLEELIKTNADNGAKGYCCFVDLNSLVFAYENKKFRKVLNNSLVNSCDGSYIALYASRIHNKRLKEYIGPDFFKKFLFYKGRHLIIGSTIQVFDKIIEKVEKENRDDISYLEIPFKAIEEFDYVNIGKEINKLKPNYIWVSLGAPKQEYFMSKLLPHINQGVMLGVGAAVNYFSGEIKDIPNWTKRIHVVWVFRLLTEPRKQLARLKTIFLTFPKMIKKEKQKAK